MQRESKLDDSIGTHPQISGNPREVRQAFKACPYVSLNFLSVCCSLESVLLIAISNFANLDILSLPFI